MSLHRLNKSEIERMNQLLENLGLENPTVDQFIETILESLDESTIEDTGKRDYFMHLDNPKNEDKRKAIIEVTGTATLSRVELVNHACKVADKAKTDFINEAVESYAVSLITASVASGRGVLGGADSRLKEAHEKITKELELGIYKPRSDAKGDIPVSKLMLEARTSKATVVSWVKRNGLEKIYGLA